MSDTGVLAHSRGLPTFGRLTWFDREGKALESLLDVGDYPSFRLSHDEKRLAVSIVDAVTSIRKEGRRHGTAQPAISRNWRCDISFRIRSSKKTPPAWGCGFSWSRK